MPKDKAEMGMCCFSYARKAAEIFHIREVLQKGIDWPGVCRGGNSSDDDTSKKKLPLLSTLVGLACLFSSSDFLSLLSPFRSQKRLALLPSVCHKLQQPVGEGVCHQCHPWQ